VSEPARRDLGTGDLDEFRRAGHELIDAVADHLEALPGRPVREPLPDDLRAALLALPLPNGPTGREALAGTMVRDVLPHAMGNGHPAFFGWVNSPPSLAGVPASLAARTLTAAAAPRVGRPAPQR
jgi:aromatic-L-amino-acid/L-tryptophan decarboxylase